MSLKLEQKTIGKLSLAIYSFEYVNDELPMHDHTEDNAHITIVNKGKLKAYGPENSWERILEKGQVVVFAPYDPHAFVALEDDSKITNIIY